jgi:hypothetical protein
VYNLETLDYQELAELRDAINRQMLKLRRTTGLRLNELLELLEEVKITLRDQGKEWRSLERWQYVDGQICFWLNPADQSRYRMGWFSIDDLIQWSHNTGPVMIEDELDELDELAGVSERLYDLAA